MFIFFFSTLDCFKKNVETEYYSLFYFVIMKKKTKHDISILQTNKL